MQIILDVKDFDQFDSFCQDSINGEIYDALIEPSFDSDKGDEFFKYLDKQFPKPIKTMDLEKYLTDNLAILIENFTVPDFDEDEEYDIYDYSDLRNMCLFIGQKLLIQSIETCNKEDDFYDYVVEKISDCISPNDLELYLKNNEKKIRNIFGLAPVENNWKQEIFQVPPVQ